MGTPDPDRMIKTSVYLTARVLEAIRAAAARRGVSSADLIRQALGNAVGTWRPPPRGGIL